MANQLFTSASWAGTTVHGGTFTRNKDLTLPFDVDDDRHNDLVVGADVPKRLKKALESGLPLISMECVKENAERILKWYENTIIEHVLTGQAKNPAFRALTGRRLEDEVTVAERSAAAQRTAATAYARSSFLAQNPFGDDPTPRVLQMDRSAGADERRALLRSIQDLNKAYARVHLPRLLTAEVATPLKAHLLQYRTNNTNDGFIPWCGSLTPLKRG